MALIKIKIQNLRDGTTSANLDDIFYVDDIGYEGIWRYDNSDTTSIDNNCSVLVSNSGCRIKKISEDLTDKIIRFDTKEISYPNNALPTDVMEPKQINIDFIGLTIFDEEIQ